ncbi:hypothetical protein FEM48_Zijuj08G0064100 [Ziziphus jujuba var. spinosa]|uniref:Uncharacterized protein n=1 Tax=Ziziphus jujuba var. spinosa TaxID=714518 RepID=A0A978UXH5_ZIZJJ|nr:hypothetical protein FEM48_Zijuj08G0064100 [Ziziphus jujuba var. spinosa]
MAESISKPLSFPNDNPDFQSPSCHDDERTALLQFMESFVIDKSTSGYEGSYPKRVRSSSCGSNGNVIKSLDDMKANFRKIIQSLTNFSIKNGKQRGPDLPKACELLG